MDKDPTLVHDISIQISRQEILRLLGAGGRGARLGESIMKMVQEAEGLGRELIKPQGIYRILEGYQLNELDYLRGNKLVGLALCTIGPKLEERVKELMASGHEPEGYVLDAVGSVAAEATADMVNGRICHWAATHDLLTTPRFSPGYGHWPLEDQRDVFRLLPAEKIGMRLNPSCMMIPRKSVSFAVAFQSDMEEKLEIPCERCGLENCPFRRK
jgi:hypothetical protein